MSSQEAPDNLERRRARFIPDPLWLAIAAASGFIAGRGMGVRLVKIAAFQHTTAAGILAACLVAFFLQGGRDCRGSVVGACG